MLAANGPAEADDLEELKLSLIQNLESAGVLSGIRAQIRACVFEAIERQTGGGCTAAAQKLCGRRLGPLCAEVIAEFFEFHGLRHTLAVFRAEAALAAVTAGQAEHSQKPWRLRCDVATDAGLRSLAEDGGSLLEQLLDANTHVKAPAPAEETEALAAREAPVAPAKEELAFAEGGAAPEPGPEPEVPEAAAAPPRQPAAGVPRSPCRGGLQALPALLPGVPARLPPLAADLGSVGPAAPTRTLQPLPQQEQPQRPQPLQPQQRQQPLRTPAAHPEQQPPQQQPPEQAAQPEVMEEQLEPELQGSPAIEPVTPTEQSLSHSQFCRALRHAAGRAAEKAAAGRAQERPRQPQEVEPERPPQCLRENPQEPAMPPPGEQQGQCHQEQPPPHLEAGDPDAAEGCWSPASHQAHQSLHALERQQQQQREHPELEQPEQQPARQQGQLPEQQESRSEQQSRQLEHQPQLERHRRQRPPELQPQPEQPEQQLAAEDGEGKPQPQPQSPAEVVGASVALVASPAAGEHPAPEPAAAAEEAPMAEPETERAPGCTGRSRSHGSRDALPAAQALQKVPLLELHKLLPGVDIPFSMTDEAREDARRIGAAVSGGLEPEDGERVRPRRGILEAEGVTSSAPSRAQRPRLREMLRRGAGGGLGAAPAAAAGAAPPVLAPLQPLLAALPLAAGPAHLPPLSEAPGLGGPRRASASAPPGRRLSGEGPRVRAEAGPLRTRDSREKRSREGSKRQGSAPQGAREDPREAKLPARPAPEEARPAAAGRPAARGARRPPELQELGLEAVSPRPASTAEARQEVEAAEAAEEVLAPSAAAVGLPTSCGAPAPEARASAGQAAEENYGVAAAAVGVPVSCGTPMPESPAGASQASTFLGASTTPQGLGSIGALGDSYSQGDGFASDLGGALDAALVMGGAAARCPP